MSQNTKNKKPSALPALKYETLAALRKQLNALNTPRTRVQWETAYKAIVNTPARIEMPLGELTNPNIAGHVMVWQMQHRIQTAPIERRDRFNAQGLEGKFIVEADLATALLVAPYVQPHRIALYARLPEELK